MLARVARYQIEPDRCDEAVRAFMDAAREVVELEGFDAGYIVVDSGSGVMLTFTVWESRAALEASEVRAAALRQRASRAVDGEIQSVGVYDVVRPFGLD